MARRGIGDGDRRRTGTRKTRGVSRMLLRRELERKSVEIKRDAGGRGNDGWVLYDGGARAEKSIGRDVTQ